METNRQRHDHHTLPLFFSIFVAVVVLCRMAFLLDLDLDDFDDCDEYDGVELLLPFLFPGPELQPRFPRFCLDDDRWTEQACLEHFRFRKEDIRLLAVRLLLPETVRKPSNRLAWCRVDGLCLVLRRLAYPNRLLELIPIFGRGKSQLSEMFNETCRLIHDRWSHLLTDLDWLPLEKVQEFSVAIGARAPLQNCWGFIDGTPRKVCRPGIGQRLFFSGHKRHHCLKFQSVVVPSGLIVNLAGPFEGRVHDANMLRQSGLMPQLQDRMNRPPAYGGGVYSLYGDPAYPTRAHLIAPFRRGEPLTPEEQLFNTQMSAVRQSVEWQFGKIVQQFAFLDFSKDLKILLQPVALLYRVGALLTNCHTCLYGSQTSSYFQCPPPALEQYLQ